MYVLLQGMTLLRLTFCERKTCQSNESGNFRATEDKGNFLLMNVLAWYCTVEAEGSSCVDFGALNVDETGRKNVTTEGECNEVYSTYVL